MREGSHGKFRCRLYIRANKFVHHTTMTQGNPIRWKERMVASGLHLGLSLVIAALAAALVFGLWYPYPYREIAGGRELFLIVIAVDVALGPLITLAVFNRNKPRGELFRDLTIVGLLQLGALAYGLWTVSVARPVHLVFEFDRFRVVHAIEVPEELLLDASGGARSLPLTGPTLLAVRPFRNPEEELTMTMVALQGVPLSALPELWQPYEQAQPRVIAAGKPLSDLRQRLGPQSKLIDAAVEQTGLHDDALRYLPMVARKAFWTVLIDARTAEVRGFIALDSF
jgi:hypothetical protein